MLKLFTPLALVAALSACQMVEAPKAAAPTGTTQAQVETALASRVTAFDKAIRGNNHAAVINMMPPKVLSLLASMSGQSVPKLKTGMAKTTREVMSGATVHTMKMDVPAGVVKTANKQRYALLPTYTDLTVAGTRMDQTTTTVAIEDNGVWYLVRVADAQTESFVKRAYPALKNVKLK